VTLVHRRDGTYVLQKSICVGGRKTSKYIACGLTAIRLAALEEEDRREKRAERLKRAAVQREEKALREHERSKTREFNGKVVEVDRIVSGYARRVTQAVDRALIAVGFHRSDPDQHWRRKQGVRMGSEVAKKANIPELMRLARDGDRIALGELSNRTQGHLYRTASDGDGYLDDEVETALIQYVPAGQALHKYAIAARLDVMKLELAPFGSSPIEILLATRAAVCWLHVQLLEYDTLEFADSNTEPNPIKAKEIDRRSMVVDKRLGLAQRRYVNALVALTKIKKMLTPVIINQLNVAQNAINIAETDRGSR